MAITDIPDVTLASADPALLKCWDKLVMQGTDCSLLLKQNKGKTMHNNPKDQYI